MKYLDDNYIQEWNLKKSSGASTSTTTWNGTSKRRLYYHVRKYVGIFHHKINNMDKTDSNY